MAELPASFYKIIRDYRHDNRMSDDQFISAIIASINRGSIERQICGHGMNHVINDSICEICQSINDFKLNSDFENL